MKIDERNGFMQEKIHEEMKKIVDGAYSKTIKFIEDNKDIITILAEKLMDKEVLEGDEVEEIINTYKNTELDNIEL